VGWRAESRCDGRAFMARAPRGLKKKRGADCSRSAIEGAGAGVGVEKWRQDGVLVDERRHVAGVGVVRSLDGCSGDPGGVVATDA
jgi:hypothetical protein